MIQPEEKERIEKFRYQADMKSSLVGRLLLRGFAVQALGIENHETVFTRTERGKPVLKCGSQGWDYNVSHAGDWVVLAAGQVDTIGVDVMRTKDTRLERLEEFFRIMRKQFTDQEWVSINGDNSSDDQILARFFRHWTLKEAYVKAVGTGLNLDLRRLNFLLSQQLDSDKVVTSSRLEVDGVMTDWVFEESILDEEHVVSVALNIKHETDCDIQHFDKLDIAQIFSLFSSSKQDQILLRPLDCNDYKIFCSKDHPKPF